jgi:hypothetical protein
MAEATIELSFAKPRYVFAESCAVAANIENLSEAPLLLSDGAPFSPLTFSLRAERDRDPRYVLSERQMAESRARGILKESPPEKASYLRPGTKRRINADLAQLGQEPFLPGKYLVTASMPGNRGSIVSAPALLEVVPASIELLARSVSGPREKASTVYVHREASGARVIFHQLSSSGSLLHSVYYRAEQAGAAVGSIATSVDAVDIQAGRRLAWFEGSHIRSLEIWDRAITKPLSTCPEELPGCAVVNPGIQFIDGSALYVVSRQESNDTGLLLYRIVGSQWTKVGEGALGAANPEGLRLALEPDGRNLRFSWSARSRVWSRRFTLELRPVDSSPHAVADANASLRAWSADAALTGSAESGLIAHLGSRTVKLPAVPPGLAAAAIAATPKESLVAVQCGQLLLVCRPGQSEWVEVAAGLGTPVSYLDLFSIDGRRYFAQWVSRESGVRFALLPKA